MISVVSQTCTLEYEFNYMNMIVEIDIFHTSVTPSPFKKVCGKYIIYYILLDPDLKWE